MTWEAWVAVGVVAGVIVGLARNLAASDALLLTALAALAGLRAASDRFPAPGELVAGFGNPALVLVAVMYVLAAGIDHTGATDWVAAHVLGRPRALVSAQLRLMLPVATLSAFVNNTPVVAMMIPVVKGWTRRHGLDPSRFYLPLSYASVLGGTCTLVGTSTTLVVQGALLAAGETPMSMFTITPFGACVAVVGVLYLVAAVRLLPHRTPTDEKLADPRRYTVEMEVLADGPLAGRTIEEAGLRGLPGLYVAEVHTAIGSVPVVGPGQRLGAGDRLILVGLVQAIVELSTLKGLRAASDTTFTLEPTGNRRRFVEAVVSHSSPVVGQQVRDSDFRTRYGATIFALHRNGELVRQRIGDLVLKPGDTLLLQTDTRFLEEQRDRQDFLLIASLDGAEAPDTSRAPVALSIFAACVALFALERFTGLPALPAAMLCACAMVMSGCCTMEQARRSIQWPVLLAIGASLGIARALETTGAATQLAQAALAPFGDLGLIGGLAGVYLLTLLLTELVTNNAAAAIAFPIAHATATSLGVPVTPFALCVALAASCGFATPLGYQTHMMVYGAGGYRLSDFLRVGLPLDLLAMAVTLTALSLAFG